MEFFDLADRADSQCTHAYVDEECVIDDCDESVMHVVIIRDMSYTLCDLHLRKLELKGRSYPPKFR